MKVPYQLNIAAPNAVSSASSPKAVSPRNRRKSPVAKSAQASVGKIRSPTHRHSTEQLESKEPPTATIGLLEREDSTTSTISVTTASTSAEENLSCRSNIEGGTSAEDTEKDFGSEEDLEGMLHSQSDRSVRPMMRSHAMRRTIVSSSGKERIIEQEIVPSSPEKPANSSRSTEVAPVTDGQRGSIDSGVTASASPAETDNNTHPVPSEEVDASEHSDQSRPDPLSISLSFSSARERNRQVGQSLAHAVASHRDSSYISDEDSLSSVSSTSASSISSRSNFSRRYDNSVGIFNPRPATGIAMSTSFYGLPTSSVNDLPHRQLSSISMQGVANLSTWRIAQQRQGSSGSPIDLRRTPNTNRSSSMYGLPLFSTVDDLPHRQRSMINLRRPAAPMASPAETSLFLPWWPWCLDRTRSKTWRV